METDKQRGCKLGSNKLPYSKEVIVIVYFGEGSFYNLGEKIFFKYEGNAKQRKRHFNNEDALFPQKHWAPLAHLEGD